MLGLGNAIGHAVAGVLIDSHQVQYLLAPLCSLIFPWLWRCAA